MFNLHEEIQWWLSRRKAQKAIRGMPRRPLTPYQRLVAWMREHKQHWWK